MQQQRWNYFFLLVTNTVYLEIKNAICRFVRNSIKLQRFVVLSLLGSVEEYGIIV